MCVITLISMRIRHRCTCGRKMCMRLTHLLLSIQEQINIYYIQIGCLNKKLLLFFSFRILRLILSSYSYNFFNIRYCIIEKIGDILISTFLIHVN